MKPRGPYKQPALQAIGILEKKMETIFYRRAYIGDILTGTMKLRIETTIVRVYGFMACGLSSFPKPQHWPKKPYSSSLIAHTSHTCEVTAASKVLIMCIWTSGLGMLRV